MVLRLVHSHVPVAGRTEPVHGSALDSRREHRPIRMPARACMCQVHSALRAILGARAVQGGGSELKLALLSCSQTNRMQQVGRRHKPHVLGMACTLV